DAVTSRAYGSFFQRGTSAKSLTMMNLYWSPTFAPATDAAQTPSPSGCRACPSFFQPLKVPLTATDLADGAQTRNATPLSFGMAPISAMSRLLACLIPSAH